jgi:hypothetical protein
MMARQSKKIVQLMVLLEACEHETQGCLMTWVVREAQAMGGVYSSTVPTKSLGTTASLTNETKHHHFPRLTTILQADHAKQATWMHQKKKQ